MNITCKEIYAMKLGEEEPKTKPTKPKPEPKPEPEPKHDMEAARAHLRDVLRKNLKPLIDRTETIESRIQFAKVIRNYLKNIQTCIHSSIDHPNRVALFEKKEKIVKERIFFDKQIGSASVYGTAYLNTGKGIARLLKFSAKVMAVKFKHEVDILKKMSALVEKKISPNMPVVYTSVLCYKPKDETLKANPAANILIRKGNYYVVLNEIANGDTHDFFQTKHIDNVYESTLTQMMFSLRAFHNLGYAHNDAHLGNFLWHKITPGGFWQYQYNDTTIYVPNTGYLMVLWDPGMATIPPAASKNSAMNDDYWRVYKLIRSIDTRKKYIKQKMVPVSSPVINPFEWIVDDMHATAPDRNYMIEEFILLLKGGTFKHLYYKTNTKNTLPPNAVLINKTPYPL